MLNIEKILENLGFSEFGNLFLMDATSLLKLTRMVSVHTASCSQYFKQIKSQSKVIQKTAPRPMS